MTAEPAEGTVTSDELVQDESAPVDPEVQQHSNEEVAKEVLAGHWNKGNRRKKLLEDAGYDPAAIDEEITKLLNQ